MDFNFNPQTHNVNSDDGLEKVPEKKKDEFVKDESDNKLFKEVQVKDISPIITEDCIGAWDSDTMIWQACANMENKTIIARHKTEDIIADVKNKTTFYGRGKQIGANSWLGLKNIEREIEGLEPLKKEDFEFEEVQKLKMSHDKAVEQVKIQIFMKMKLIRQQFGVPKVKLVIGEGDNFRHELDQVRKYKGNRAETSRPLLLKEIRKWVVDELEAEVAGARADGQMVEADDVVEYYGFKGYMSYRKTGKFNYVTICADKDSRHTPSLLIDPSLHTGENNPLRGKFKLPHAILVEASDKDVGNLELVAKGGKTASKEVKGYGFKFLMYQAFLGKDQADNYDALGHLSAYRKSVGEEVFDFGDISAYKALQPCKTSQEALQKCIDIFAELLPYGVQYTNWKGEELDVDTFTYMSQYFQTAYMLRSAKDTMTLDKLCAAMKVDTSKVVGNNTKTPPQRVFVGSEDKILEIQSALQEIESGIGSFKSLKKSELVDKLEGIETDLVKALELFEGMYEMHQKEKTYGED